MLAVFTDATVFSFLPLLALTTTPLKWQQVISWCLLFTNVVKAVGLVK